MHILIAIKTTMDTSNQEKGITSGVKSQKHWTSDAYFILLWTVPFPVKYLTAYKPENYLLLADKVI